MDLIKMNKKNKVKAFFEPFSLSNQKLTDLSLSKMKTTTKQTKQKIYKMTIDVRIHKILTIAQIPRVDALDLIKIYTDSDFVSADSEEKNLDTIKEKMDTLWPYSKNKICPVMVEEGKWKIMPIYETIILQLVEIDKAPAVAYRVILYTFE